MPHQSCERCTERQEALLSLQQPRSFHQGVSASEISQEGIEFKLKRGDGTKEGSPDPSRKGNSTKGAPGWGAQGIEHSMQTPFLNPNPFQQWYGVKNMARVRVNGESCMALLGNGAQINAITLSFAEEHSLDLGPLTNLVGGWVSCVGLGNVLTQPLGYVVIWIQEDGIQGYDEDQIALVILDLSNFVVWVPLILGTHTISHVVNMIKEKEIDALAISWVNAQVAHLLSVWRAAATVKDDQIAGNSNLGGYDEMVLIQNTETIDAFSSCVITAKASTAHTSERIDVMTQAVCVEDSSLPQGLMVQNAYTKLRKGSKNVIVVVRNSTAHPQTLKKKTLVARAVEVTQVPEPLVQIGWMGWWERWRITATQCPS